MFDMSFFKTLGTFFVQKLWGMMAPEAPLVALPMRQVAGQEFWAELVVETAPWHRWFKLVDCWWSHTIHGPGILYLHLVDLYGKCR